MRADRLLALLMLLQSRGKTTAAKLAEELEVSERTMYRDVQALAMAGVPVYAESGPGGGIALLDSYRTNLTGLTEPELRALFMLSIPAPLARLGVGQELRAAMLKLAAAVPSARRSDEARVRQRIHLDSAWWFQGEEPLPYLQAIYRALWEDRRLRLTYLRRFEPRGELKVHHVVDPYGLVAKASVWYLVAARGRDGPTDARANSRAAGPHVYEVSLVLDASLLDEGFDRPAEFDLAAWWSAWCAERERSHAGYVVKLRVAPELIPELARHFGAQVQAAAALAEPDEDGWVTLVLPFAGLEAARGRLLAFGGAVEVLEPRALRLSLADFAAQAVARYQR